jgi:hypothetical protein
LLSSPDRGAREGSDLPPPTLRRRRSPWRAALAQHRPAFLTAAEAYIKAHERSWGNPKHVEQWIVTLAGKTPDGTPTRATNSCKHLHPLCVDQITTQDVLWS